MELGAGHYLFLFLIVSTILTLAGICLIIFKLGLAKDRILERLENLHAPIKEVKGKAYDNQVEHVRMIQLCGQIAKGLEELTKSFVNEMEKMRKENQKVMERLLDEKKDGK